MPMSNCTKSGLRRDISVMRNMLMANHPNDVPSEWLTEVSTSSMMLATTTASSPQSVTK